MMLREIVSATLGFFTIPMIGLAIAGMVGGGKIIASFDLPLPHYWIGFFLLIGLCIIAGCVLALWTA